MLNTQRYRTKSNPFNILHFSLVPVEKKVAKKKISVVGEFVPDPLWDIPGPFLLLEFWTSILECDLKDWFELYRTLDQIYFRAVERPLLARVFFYTGEVRWNRRCEMFCKLYVAGLSKPAQLNVRTCIRYINVFSVVKQT